MRRFWKHCNRRFFSFLLGVMLLVVAGCRAQETPVPSKPTREMAVVVFQTEAPTAIPSPTTSPTPAPSPTPGMGVAAATRAISATTSTTINRPPDVNPLTGLKVTDQALLRRRPIMVRVGNDPAARPQVGLDKADIVYEELVEWWVTRFTAIFLGQDPEMIAPIRSARLINLQLTPQYQGALANSGGSDPVRWELSQTDIVNLDEFFTPLPYFYRENEGWQTRLAFNAVDARKYMKDEGLEADVKLRGFVFSDQLDAPLTGAPEAKKVVIPYPAQTSEATWEYDPAAGKYKRSTTGEPMTDFEGRQLTAANVIIYFAEHQDTDIVEDSNGATSVRIIVNGRGPAWLLRDGRILKGNWETDGRQTPNFIFDNGQPMPLKPGNTWVEVVPLDYVIEVDGKEYPLESAAPAKVETPASQAPAKPTPTLAPTATPIGFRAQATPGN